MIDFLYKYKCIPVLDINNDIYIHSYSKPVIFLKYLLGVYLIPLNELENDIENLNKMDIDIIKLIQEFLENDSCIELKSWLSDYNNKKILNKVEEKEIKIITKRNKI